MVNWRQVTPALVHFKICKLLQNSDENWIWWALVMLSSSGLHFLYLPLLHQGCWKEKHFFAWTVQICIRKAIILKGKWLKSFKVLLHRTKKGHNWNWNVVERLGKAYFLDWATLTFFPCRYLLLIQTQKWHRVYLEKKGCNQLHRKSGKQVLPGQILQIHCLGKAEVKKGLKPGQQWSAGSPQLWPHLAGLYHGRALCSASCCCHIT